MFGFYRIAVCAPQLKVADVTFNTAEIIRCAGEAAENGAALILFPELCLTGATCGDLFRQKKLTDAAMDGLEEIADALAESNITAVAGLPVRERNQVIPCSALIQHGTITLCGDTVFDCGNGIRLAVQTGADQLSLADSANVILVQTSEPAIIGQRTFRRDLFRVLSGQHHNVIVFASAGVNESTTDGVCSGHCLICENGEVLAENPGFSTESKILYADVDLEKTVSLCSCGCTEDEENGLPVLESLTETDSIQYRTVDPLPFIPENRDAGCSEVFEIQVNGLMRRLTCSGSQKAVLGISGGLDSTLAMLVSAEAVRRLGWKSDRLLAITMPGFGTTERTKGNSEILSEQLGCELRKIDIRPACLQHFSDIGHNPEVLDVTYENVQARERTQILMDTANRERGLVIGTGDLSEIALGWSTYNADHMSMYNVNCDVSKTLIRAVVDWYAENHPEVRDVLKDILATPVSPELLPGDQKTESILGAYELHDFYLYHFVRYGAAPEKIRYLAGLAFGEKYPAEEIDRTLKLFLRRFFTQQFKRSCSPDGPKVGSVALSPRSGWAMPSDVSMSIWMEQ